MNINLKDFLALFVCLGFRKGFLGHFGFFVCLIERGEVLPFLHGLQLGEDGRLELFVRVTVRLVALFVLLPSLFDSGGKVGMAMFVPAEISVVAPLFFPLVSSGRADKAAPKLGPWVRA